MPEPEEQVVEETQDGVQREATITEAIVEFDKENPEIVEEEKEKKSLQDFPFFNLMRIRKEILGENIYGNIQRNHNKKHRTEFRGAEKIKVLRDLDKMIASLGKNTELAEKLTTVEEKGKGL